MRKRSKIVLILFIIIAFINVYVAIIGKTALEILFKPMLIPVLAIFYFFSVKKTNICYLLALLFSFLGDALPSFKGWLFILGVVFTLIAQLFFLKVAKSIVKKIHIRKIATTFLMFMGYLALLVWLIKDKAGEMVIPVIVFGIITAVFGSITYVDNLNKRNGASLMLFLGAFIMIISDSFITLNMFYNAKIFHTAIIIGLYALAQYLICKSLIKYQLKGFN